WDKAALFDLLASGWENIYKQAADSTPLAAEAAGKYSTRLKGRFNTDFKTPLPEPELWNSYRSMLIRSRYPDEALPLSDLARMKPAKLDFRPPSFIYGGGYLYPLGAYYFALSKVGAVKPLSLRSVLEKPDTLGRIYLVGRLVSAAAFAGICLLVFLIVRRLEPGGAAYAAFAAALMLPALGIHARYLTPHLWAAFWAMSAIYLSLRSLPALKLKPLLAAGACLGLASGSYWSAAHTSIFVLAILLSPGREAMRPAALKRLALATGLCAAVFLALNPYLPFNWHNAVQEFFPDGASPGPDMETGLYILFVKILPITLGPVFAVLFPVGCLWGIFSGRPLLRNLSAAALLFASPVSTTLCPDFPAGVRRFFPWLLTGVMIGTVFLGRLTVKLKSALRATVFSLALAPGFIMSAAYAFCFIDASGPHSTFYRMADTLDSMSAGNTLGMLEFPQPGYMPAFRLDRWRLRLADEAALPAMPLKDLPEYLLVNFNQKAGLYIFLHKNYEIHTGFYPRTVLGFNPEPFLCGANPPLELYRLKQRKAL
ncbi:MAG: hypothetical protein AAB359_08440, partial [Elusimicrobiota bacterium]